MVAKSVRKTGWNGLGVIQGSISILVTIGNFELSLVFWIYLLNEIKVASFKNHASNWNRKLVHITPKFVFGLQAMKISRWH